MWHNSTPIRLGVAYPLNTVWQKSTDAYPHVKKSKKSDTKILKINKKLNHKNTQNIWSLGNSPKILKIIKKLGTLDLPWKIAQKKNTKDLRKT